MMIRPEKAESMFGAEWRSKVTIAQSNVRVEGWIFLSDWPGKCEVKSPPPTISYPNGLGTILRTDPERRKTYITGFDDELQNVLWMYVVGAGTRCEGKRMADKIDRVVNDVSTLTPEQLLALAPQIRACLPP